MGCAGSICESDETQIVPTELQSEWFIICSCHCAPCYGDTLQDLEDMVHVFQSSATNTDEENRHFTELFVCPHDTVFANLDFQPKLLKMHRN